MAKRREDFPLEKITLNLYDGEYAKLQSLYTRQGASKIVRTLVHAHLKKVEERAAQARPTINQLDIDLREIEDV